MRGRKRRVNRVSTCPRERGREGGGTGGNHDNACHGYLTFDLTSKLCRDGAICRVLADQAALHKDDASSWGDKLSPLRQTYLSTGATVLLQVPRGTSISAQTHDQRRATHKPHSTTVPGSS